MQHMFSGKEGEVEVTLSKEGDVFVLEGHRTAALQDGRMRVWFSDGTVHLAHVAKVGDVWWVHLNGQTFRWERIEPGSSSNASDGGLVAPMPGKVLEVLVAVGQEVEAGQALMVLEAMKMEHRIVATADGVVTALHFNAGDQVVQGAALLEIEETN